MSALPRVAESTREQIAREFDDLGPDACIAEISEHLHDSNPEWLYMAAKCAEDVGDARHGILRSEHVVKLRHLLQLISAGALDADLALHGFHIDSRYRQRHSMCTNTEESADFKNYEEYSIT